MHVKLLHSFMSPCTSLCLFLSGSNPSSQQSVRALSAPTLPFPLMLSRSLLSSPLSAISFRLNQQSIFSDSSQSPGQAGSRMKNFIATWALQIMMGWAVEPAGATRAFSPTGSPHCTLVSEAPAQGTANGAGLVSEWVKVAGAVCLGLLLLAWRIWDTIKNTEAWRNLNVLGGENPPAEADEEVPADNDRLFDNRYHSDLELTNRPAATPNPPASRHTIMQPLPNLHDEGRSEATGASPGTTFTRVSNWTSSSMSIHESHNSHPAFTRRS